MVGQTDKSSEDESSTRQIVPDSPVSLLLFTASGECWGLPISAIQEIQPQGRVTRVPHAPPAVFGIVNLRGKVLTLYHLKGLIGGLVGDRERDTVTHIIVLAPEDVGRSVGIVVGEILRVIEVPLPREEGTEGICQGIITVDGHAVSILHPHLLLSAPLSFS